MYRSDSPRRLEACLLTAVALFVLVGTPAQAQTQLDIIADPALDGWVQEGDQGQPCAGQTTGTLGPLRIGGVGESCGVIRGFVSFDLDPLFGANVQSAELILYQLSSTGLPFLTGGPVLVDWVDYGSSLDPGDFDVSSLQINIGNLPQDDQQGIRTIDVTSLIQTSVAQSRERFQTRLRFQKLFPKGVLNVSSSDSPGGGTQPTLRVVFTAGPNLDPSAPEGWSGPLVVSNQTGTNVDDTTLGNDETLYLDWAVSNSGGQTISSSFVVEVLLDGGVLETWNVPGPLGAGEFFTIEDYSFGPLSSGNHSLLIRVDSEDDVAESNEADNDSGRDVLINSPPVADAGEDKTAQSGDTVPLQGSGEDQDGGALSFLWEQLSGPSVTIFNPDQADASFVAPDVEIDTPLDFRLTVRDVFQSEDSDEVMITVQRRVLLGDGVVIPASLSENGGLFAQTFVGAALVNAAATENTPFVLINNSDGNTLGETDILPPLNVKGQTAFLTGQVLDGIDDAALLIANGRDGPVQGFFLAGSDSADRLDGIGAKPDEAGSLYLTGVSYRPEVESYLFVFNSNSVPAPDVSVALRDGEGSVAEETTIAIAPRGAATGTLTAIFDGLDPIENGYLSVTSSVPLQAFLLRADSGTLAAETAFAPVGANRLVSPHFFVDSTGGTTTLTLLNIGDSSVSVQARIFPDSPLPTRNSALSEASFAVAARSQVQLDVGELFELDSQAVTGALVLDLDAGQIGPFPRLAQAQGSMTYSQPTGPARATLPLLASGRQAEVFLQIAQSPVERLFTGLVVANVGEQTATVTLQVYDASGQMSAEKDFFVPGGTRVIDLLDSSTFFGPSFVQVGGHMRLTSNSDVFTAALYGDLNGTFLAAIVGQPPVE